MRHNVKGRKLGRTTEHRLALFRNQLSSLVAAGRIRTTLAKAKELRPLAERMVTKGKRGSVHARRQVRQWIDDRTLVKKLFDDIAPRFQERPGGYTRIVKLGPRPGDGAEMAVLEWVDFEVQAAPAEAPEEKKGRGRKAKAPAAEKAEAPAKKARGGKAAKAAETEGGEEKPKKKAAPRRKKAEAEA